MHAQLAREDGNLIVFLIDHKIRKYLPKVLQQIIDKKGMGGEEIQFLCLIDSDVSSQTN